jgi:dolichyl-phosphate beta-glucosyltransferase
VVPAFNEGGRIRGTLRGIFEYMDGIGHDFELIVVDDGSTDDTAAVVRDLCSTEPRMRLLANKANMGKGYSVRRGILEAGGDVVLFSDADLSTPIEEYGRLLEYLGDYDLVMASRSLPESNVVVHQPAYREMMGRMFNFLVQVLIVRGIIDTQCGFKLMKAEAGREIAGCLRINRFSFDVEMVLVAKRLGYRCVDVPVKWINSPGSRVDAVKDSVNMLLDLFRIKLYDIAGRYRKRTGRE